MDKNKPKPKFKLFGHKVLNNPTEPVSEEYLKSNEFKEVVRRLIEISDTDQMGGLAANQIGVPKSIAMVRLKPSVKRPDIKETPLTILVNPKIIKESKETQYYWEGCFSNLGLRFYVPTPEWMEIKYLDDNGKPITKRVEGLEAIVTRHEIDHLQGINCGERVLMHDNRVVRGAIITEDEYYKDINQIPIGVQEELDTD